MRPRAADTELLRLRHRRPPAQPQPCGQPPCRRALPADSRRRHSWPTRCKSTTMGRRMDKRAIARLKSVLRMRPPASRSSSSWAFASRADSRSSTTSPRVREQPCAAPQRPRSRGRAGNLPRYDRRGRGSRGCCLPQGMPGASPFPRGHQRPRERQHHGERERANGPLRLSLPAPEGRHDTYVVDPLYRLF